MAGPLTDVTVLDLTQYITGPYATKLLADYGADVIKVERPGGDPARRLGPFKGGEPHPEKSGTFFYFNANKRSIVLDLKRPAAGGAVERLLSRVDVVVESFRPGTADHLGVGWQAVAAARKDLPLVSITNFGQDSPYKDYKGSDVILYGFAGEMYSMGILGREPVKMYGTGALVEAGAAASTAIMAAVMVGRLQGVGQHVDFSIADAHFGGVDRRHATVIAHQYSGRKTTRPPGGTQGLANGVYPCADGFIEFSVAGLRLDRMADMLGNPEWLQDPKWLQPGASANPELVEEFNGNFLVWLVQRTKREVFAEARRAKVLCGPLYDVKEMFEDEHFRGRRFWHDVEHEEMGSFEIPGRPFIMNDSPWELRRPAPLLGEHTGDILEELGYSRAEVADLLASGTVAAHDG
jgi:crotonobetainyl-CoA:carnitine CoA-transferase CaiB-like acyl-CoA transferase